MVRLFVRMHDRETVELFLLAREDGMCVSAASAFAGVSRDTGRRWGRGELPHGHTGAPAARGGGGIPARKTAERKGGRRGRPGPLRSPRGRAAVRPHPRQGRERAARGGVGRPKSGRLAAGFDVDREPVRARGEIDRGDRPVPDLDSPVFGDR